MEMAERSGSPGYSEGAPKSASPQHQKRWHQPTGGVRGSCSSRLRGIELFRALSELQLGSFTRAPRWLGSGRADVLRMGGRPQT